MLPPYALVLVSLGVVFVSFICLLVGHRMHEEFQAPPLFFHGFIAAPALEWITFLYRVGLSRPEGLESLEREVRDLRRRVKEAQEVTGLTNDCSLCTRVNRAERAAGLTSNGNITYA